MRKANNLTRSTATILAALALTSCARTAAAPVVEPDTAPTVVIAPAEQEPETTWLKKNFAGAVVRPAEKENGPASGSQPGEDAAPTAAPTAEPPTEKEPVATPNHSEDPAPTATPEPTPKPAPAATSEPTAAPAPAPADGAIPFHLAAGTNKWWQIDSSDSAYWAVQDQINAMRAAGGLPALTMDSGLSATASARCESFVAGGPFDHSGMVTKSEICAAGPLFTASAVCGAWQASEAHYANIMRTDISRMGVGCWFCSVDGNQYTYWTVTFE